MSGRGVVTGASASALAALVVLLIAGPADRVSGPVIVMGAFALSFLPIGWSLVRHLGLTRVAVSVWLTGFTALAWLIAQAASGWTVGAWAAQWLVLAPWGLLVVVLLRFPDGATRGWRRRLSGITNAVLALGCTALAGAAVRAPRTLLTDTETRMSGLSGVLARAGAWAGLALVALAIAAIALLVRRAVLADASHRWNYAALVPAAVLFPTGVAFDIAGLDDATVAGIVAVPLGMGLAVLQSAWQDLDVLVDRRLISGGVWLVVFCALAVVMLAVIPVTDHVSPPVAALALALLVIALAVVRRRLLIAANRWLYGGVDDPFALIREVGERMDASLDPLETLRRSPAALSRALRLPYAAILLQRDGTESVIAVDGRRLVTPVPHLLVAGGVVLGRLEVSPRGYGQQLSATETRLVETVARHAARVAEAYLLSLDVQGARERLVSAREEERVRLRNDLHDGLGPLLVGARMQLAAAARAGSDARRADLVAGASADLGTASTTVRELIDGLRPAALDGGLVTALEDAAHGLLPDCEVVLDAPAELAPMPPAVEIAAYRIVTEAVTNVARHAVGVTRCTVSVRAAQHLVLLVGDDGPGVQAGPGAGVGLVSMRARAEELGGSCEISGTPEGTTVRVVLPLSASPRAAQPRTSRDVVPVDGPTIG
ncbi:MAG: histidine kinase [Actinobacteria bacterium]|nr:histidine kinase [Actinomycetota bacterium]